MCGNARVGYCFVGNIGTCIFAMKHVLYRLELILVQVLIGTGAGVIDLGFCTIIRSTGK
jgi:hypothetical protein